MMARFDFDQLYPDGPQGVVNVQRAVTEQNREGNQPKKAAPLRRLTRSLLAEGLFQRKLQRLANIRLSAIHVQQASRINNQHTVQLNTPAHEEDDPEDNLEDTELDENVFAKPIWMTFYTSMYLMSTIR